MTGQNPVSHLRNPWVFLATGFGTGFTPKAPGTVGTLLALPLFVVLAYWHWAVSAAVLIVMFGVGVVICDRAAGILGLKDPGSIVWDEFVGMGITVLTLTPILSVADAVWWLVAFVLFRVFDIAKPWPVRYFDRWSGGMGIMMDDVAAGIYAWCCLQALILLEGLLL
ncbi:MAG: phosphatidylglycerophosphatase A [Pseudomonadota bacterium]